MALTIVISCSSEEEIVVPKEENVAEKLNDETCTALRDAFGEKSAFLEQLARTLLNRRS